MAILLSESGFVNYSSDVIASSKIKGNL